MSDAGDKPGADEPTKGDEATDSSADAEFPQEDSADAADTPDISIAPQPRGFSPVAWLALLLSLGAVAAVGWLWAREPPAPPPVTGLATQSSVDELNRALSASEESMAAMQSRLSTLLDAEAARSDQTVAMDRELRMRLEAMESIPGRLANLEGSISSLQGISSGVRDTWLLAEAEYYMQIANAQLQLAGNPHLASLALRLADEKVLSLANPALTNVRRALSDELRALDGMEKPDIEGITLTLASLADVVATLPLKSQTMATATDDAEVDAELSGVDRALASFTGAMSKAVSVRQIDEAERPFVAPEAEYFLRANLSLQLQAARLALLRGERELFEQSIGDAQAWLERYYDVDAAGVKGAIDTIAGMKSGLFAISPPDISGSLQLLRQFNALNEYSADTTAAEPAGNADVAPAGDTEPVTEPESDL